MLRMLHEIFLIIFDLLLMDPLLVSNFLLNLQKLLLKDFKLFILSILIDFILGDCVDERVIAVLPIFVFVLQGALFVFKRWCPKILRRNIDDDFENIQ